MVHANRTVVVLLNRHFSSWLITLCNSVSIVTNCTYITMSDSNIMAYVNISFTFFKLAYYIYFLFNMNWFFCQFFTWSTLGDVDLRFSLIFTTKSNTVKEGTMSVAWLYHQCDKSTHVADGMQCRHFLLATSTRQVQPGIIYATSNETKLWHIISAKSH